MPALIGASNSGIEDPQLRSPAQRIKTPIGVEARPDIERLLNSPRLELGESITTDDSVIVDKPKQRKRFWKFNDIGPGAKTIAVKRREKAGDRTPKERTWVSRILGRLLAMLRADMQVR